MTAAEAAADLRAAQLANPTACLHFTVGGCYACRDIDDQAPRVDVEPALDAEGWHSGAVLADEAGAA